MSVAEANMPAYERKVAKRGRRVEWVGRTDEMRFVVPFIFDFDSSCLRSIAKAAIHAAADSLGAHAVRGGTCRRLAGWILDDQVSATVLNDLVAWDYDTPDISSAAFYHGVEVTACSDVGTLLVRVHVYGIWRFRFLLDDAYVGSAHSVRRLVQDPRAGIARWRSARCLAHPIGWLMTLATPSQSAEYRDDATRRYLSEHGPEIMPDGWNDLSDPILRANWGQPPI